MAWCPKCRNEYREGITHCSDCDVDLVDTLEDMVDLEYIHIGYSEVIDELVDYLQQVGIDSAQSATIDDEPYIAVEKDMFENATLHLSVYLKNKAELEATKAEDSSDTNEITEDFADVADNCDDTHTNIEDDGITPKEDEQSDFYDEESPSISSSTYTKLSDKYEDVKSSSYTLLIVGITGLVALLFEVMGFYTIPVAASTKWLFYLVMCGIFIIFIISGIASAIHAKQLKIDAANEDETIEKITTWFNENFTSESIDSNIDTEVQEELLYFNRAEFIKNALMHQFEDADEDLIDSLIENFYTSLYEKE